MLKRALMVLLCPCVNQEDIGKEIVYNRITSTLIVSLDTGKHL